MKLKPVINVLILEQESAVNSRLRDLLSLERDIHLITSVQPAHFLRQISSLRPDAIFIDSALLSGMAGFPIAGSVHFPILVVTGTTTAQALRAFELAAIDFLLEPLDDERLQLTLERLRSEVERREKDASLDVAHLFDYVGKHLAESQSSGIAHRVPIQFGRRHRFIEASDICYVTARGTYVSIKMASGSMLNASDSITAMERRLPTNLFLRINRSVIVNSLFVQEVITGNRARKVLMNDESIFPVGPAYKNRFSRYLKSEGTDLAAKSKVTPSFDQLLSFTSRSRSSPPSNK
jgi:two-component system LytT family response regulator